MTPSACCGDLTRLSFADFTYSLTIITHGRQNLLLTTLYL